MRRSIERDCVEVCHMSNLVHALRPGVLAGHDIPAQINCDGVWAVHPTFLAKCLDGPAALDSSIELVDALAEAKRS